MRCRRRGGLPLEFPDSVGGFAGSVDVDGKREAYVVLTLGAEARTGDADDIGVVE